MTNQERFPGKVQPSHGQAIKYTAYTRKFSEDAAAPVLYITATCSYPVGPYEIFFQGEGGFTWTLMEKAPTIFYNLVTYHIACTTTGQPTLDIPDTITIKDGYGSHEVPVDRSGG